MVRTRSQSTAAASLPETASVSTPSVSTTKRKVRRARRDEEASGESEDSGESSPYFDRDDDRDDDEEIRTPTKRAKKPKRPSSPRKTPIEPLVPVRELLPHGIKPDPNHFGLVQEYLVEDRSPLGCWKMVIACILLNQTSARWPTPADLAAADEQELIDMLYCIGLYNRRARTLINMSTTWCASPPSDDTLHRNKSARDYPPTPISHLPGVGAYCLDSWTIFVADGGSAIAAAADGQQTDNPRWRSCMPADKELRAYLIWRWAKEGIEWDIEQGVIGALQAETKLEV